MLLKDLKGRWGYISSYFILSAFLFTYSCSEEESLVPENTVEIEEIPGEVTPTTGGVYYILNRKSNRYLEVENASNSNGASIQQGSTSFNSSDTHAQWEILSTGNGYVRLKGVDSGKSIEVKGGSNSNGTDIEQRSYAGETHQQWEILSTGNGFYRLKSRDSGKSIRIKNGSNSNGADAESRSYDGSSDYQWMFIEVNGSTDGNGGDNTGGDANCTSAACVISGSSTNFSRFWKLNGFSGNLDIGRGSYGRDGSNGLDYEDRASTSDNNNWFFDTNGYASFKCHVGNPTSSGSGNMRSELRELDGNGREIEWDGTNNSLNKMTYEVQIRQLPSSGKLCFGQIHSGGNFDDVIRLQLEDFDEDRRANSGSGSGTFDVIVRGYVTENLNNPERTGFKMEMDKAYTIEITMRNSVVTASIDGTEVFRATGVNSRENYFKAGTYIQSAQSSKSPRLVRNINNFGEVWIKNMQVSH